LLVDLDPRQPVEVVGKPAGAGSAAALPAKQNLGRVFLGKVIGDRSYHHLNHQAERFFLRVIFLRVQLAELEGLGRGTSLFLLFQQRAQHLLACFGRYAERNDASECFGPYFGCPVGHRSSSPVTRCFADRASMKRCDVTNITAEKIIARPALTNWWS